jgi:Fe-S cluster assembly iron-binding protein IscA
MLDTQTLTLNISDLAQEKLREVVAAKGGAEVAVRVFAQDAGEGAARYGMALDGDQLADDTVLEFEGFKVFVDRDSAEFAGLSMIPKQRICRKTSGRRASCSRAKGYGDEPWTKHE